MSPRSTRRLVDSRKLWDTKTGAELSSFAHKHIVRAVHFSEVRGRGLNTAARLVVLTVSLGGLHAQNDGSFATGGYEKQLRLFDLTNYNAGTVGACVSVRRGFPHPPTHPPTPPYPTSTHLTPPHCAPPHPLRAHIATS